MRNLVLIILGFLLLTLQGALSVRLIPHPLAPNMLLPLAIYIGVSPHVDLIRGAAIVFFLGYLMDSFCGSPMGLQTFALVSTYMVTRGAGLRLFLRRPISQVLLTFIASVLSGATILALRSIFEKPVPFPLGLSFDLVRLVFISSLCVALFSPIVFVIIRRVEAAFYRGEMDAGMR